MASVLSCPSQPGYLLSHSLAVSGGFFVVVQLEVIIRGRFLSLPFFYLFSKKFLKGQVYSAFSHYMGNNEGATLLRLLALLVF